MEQASRLFDVTGGKDHGGGESLGSRARTGETPVPPYQKQATYGIWANARPGVTILESVMAALLLGLICATIFSTVSAVATADLRGQQRLEALELSNRLILQYLDDKNKMPSEATRSGCT